MTEAPTGVAGALAALSADPWRAARLVLGDPLHPGGEAATESLLDRAGVGPGTRLLDVGCGAGRAVELARDRGARAVGLDAAAPSGSSPAPPGPGSGAPADAGADPGGGSAADDGPVPGGDPGRASGGDAGTGCGCASTGASGSASAGGEGSTANTGETAGAPAGRVRGTADRLPVAAGALDVALAECALCLAPSLPRALAELRRALAEGGRLALSEVVIDGEAPSLPRALADPLCLTGARGRERLRGEIEAAGFAVRSVRDHRADLLAMRDRARSRVDYEGLLGALGEDELLAGVRDLEAAVEEGRVGYVSMVADVTGAGRG